MFRINALINQKLLEFSTVSPDFKALSFFRHMTEAPEGIYEISITESLVIITTQYMTQTDSAVTEYTTYTNNINAYDRDGNHLWNISDIIGGDITYVGAVLSTKEIMKNYYGFDGQLYDDSCELLNCAAEYDRLYIIDLNRRKLRQVLITK